MCMQHYKSLWIVYNYVCLVGSSLALQTLERNRRGSIWPLVLESLKKKDVGILSKIKN